MEIVNGGLIVAAGIRMKRANSHPCAVKRFPCKMNRCKKEMARKAAVHKIDIGGYGILSNRAI